MKILLHVRLEPAYLQLPIRRQFERHKVKLKCNKALTIVTKIGVVSIFAYDEEKFIILKIFENFCVYFNILMFDNKWPIERLYPLEIN